MKRINLFLTILFFVHTIVWGQIEVSPNKIDLKAGADPSFLLIRDIDSNPEWDLSLYGQEHFVISETNGAPRFTILKGGNVGIGTASPETSAIVDMASTAKGLLIPRMTTAERVAISSPANGLLVYDHDHGSFFYCDVSKWQNLGVPSDKNPFDILKVDAAGNAIWQPLSETPSPALSLSGSLPGTDATSVVVQGGFAYIVAAGIFKIINVSNASAPTLSGSLMIGPGPVSVAVEGNYAYVVDNISNDLKIIDISVPNEPMLRGSAPSGVGSKSAAVQDDLVYVLSDSPNDFKIYDVSNPSMPTFLGSLTLGNSSSVTVQGDYAYVTLSAIESLKVIDVSNPVSPMVVSSSALGFTEPVSVSVQDNFVYLVDGPSATLHVIDVSIPSSPSLTGSLSIGAAPISVKVQGKFAFVSDAATEDLKVINISDPAYPLLSTSILVGSNPSSVAIQGNYAYLTGNSNPAFTESKNDFTTGANLSGTDFKIIQLSPVTAVGIDLSGGLYQIPLTQNAVMAKYAETIHTLTENVDQQRTDINNLKRQFSEMEKLRATTEELKSQMATLQALFTGPAKEHSPNKD